MSKQTRKSVSLKGTTFAKLKSHCEAEGISMAGLVESLCAKFFAKHPELATDSKREPQPPKPKKARAKKAKKALKPNERFYIPDPNGFTF